jgi:perosamine synthetase
MTIDLFKPDMGIEECQAVGEVLLSGWTGLGPITKDFELFLGEYIKMPYVVAMNSCTAALDIAVRLLNIGPGDEVLVPTITFVSTAHAVCYSGATPVFCDVDPKTLLIDFGDVSRKISSKTKAIIPVHYSGRCVNISKLREVVGSKVYIIEDCAHAMGSYFNGQHAGTWGDIACYSFHAVKNLSCGDGGALATKNKEWKERASKLRWLGIDKGTWDRSSKDGKYGWEYEVEEIGLKCHMNDITAAIGLEQLKKLEKMNLNRKNISQNYMKGLEGISQIQLPPDDDENSSSSWHLFVIQAEDRDKLAAYLSSGGISTGVHYKPIHLYSCYGNPSPSLPMAERAIKSLLSLPIYSQLAIANVAYILKQIKDFYAWG